MHNSQGEATVSVHFSGYVIVIPPDHGWKKRPKHYVIDECSVQSVVFALMIKTDIVMTLHNTEVMMGDISSIPDFHACCSQLCGKVCWWQRVGFSQTS